MITFPHNKYIIAFWRDEKYPKHNTVLHVNIERRVKGRDRNRLYINITPASAERIYQVILRGNTFFKAAFPATKDKPRASCHRFKSWKKFRAI